MIIDRDHIELTDEFRNALRLMEDTDSHLFITGNAGTGKSTLLELFREETSKEIAIVAPTGIAALNVRGSTIHSLFRFPPRIITKEGIYKIPGGEELFSALEVLVIDEISMVRADLLDGIDKSSDLLFFLLLFIRPGKIVSQDE